MKRLLFVFFAVFSAFVFVFFTVARTERSVGDDAISRLADFSSWVVFSVFEDDGSQTGLPVLKNVETPVIDQLAFIRLSPLNTLTYISSQAPWVRKTEGSTVLRIQPGMYAMNISDPFEKTTIEADSFRISVLGGGVLYVDSTQTNDIKIYSASTVASVELLSGTESTSVATFKVLPSMLFVYSPSNNNELKGADGLRIATLNTVRLIDIGNTENMDYLTAGSKTAKKVLDTFFVFETKRAKELTKIRGIIFDRPERANGPSFLEQFSLFFVNKEKKRILLKNFLARQIANFASSCGGAKLSTTACRDGSDKVTRIRDTLNSMKELSEESYISGITALKEAYYLSAYAPLSLSEKDRTIDTVVNPYEWVVRGVLWIGKTEQQYRMLADIYTYTVLPPNIGRSKLSFLLSQYFKWLVAAKSIEEKDLLIYAYFLKEYLATSTMQIDTETLDVVYYLVSIANGYYDTLKTDEDRFSMLSLFFFNYEEIFDTLAKNIDTRFFVQDATGKRLQGEYVNANNSAKLPDGFLETLQLLVTLFDPQDVRFSKQKTLYSEYIKGTGNDGMTDRFSVFLVSLDKLREFQNIFSNYATYFAKLGLWSESRDASGVSVGTRMPTRDELIEYFSVFIGFDKNSLIITNNPQNDGYVALNFLMDSRKVSLNLKPDRHVISGLLFDDGAGGVNRAFVSLSVSLDDRKKALESSWTSGDKPNFARFFQDTYFSPRIVSYSEDQKPIIQDTDRPSIEMTDTMIRFVEDELIGKDFKNIAEFLPIAIWNIHAKIVNGAYDITLKDIKKEFLSSSARYEVSLSGKYIFTSTEHQFSELSLRSKDILLANSIAIAPQRIDLFQLETSMALLGKYLDLLVSKKPDNSATVTFDLSNKSVIIDGTSYPIN